MGMRSFSHNAINGQATDFNSDPIRRYSHPQIPIVVISQCLDNDPDVTTGCQGSKDNCFLGNHLFDDDSSDEEEKKSKTNYVMDDVDRQ